MNNLQDFDDELARGKKAVELAFVTGTSAALVGVALAFCTIWAVW
jgi:hypothetical protein